MRDYGRVYSKFWTSDDIQTLTDDGKMLALYLLSGPHGTIAGVCRLPHGYVCEDLKWPEERVTKGFGELLDNRFANRCATTKWVWICRFLEWNTPENPNQWKAARKIALSVPDNCSWKPEFSRVFAISAGDVTEIQSNPLITVAEGLPTQKQDQKQEQKQDQDSSRAPRETGNQATAAPSDADHPAPTPRGSLPNSLGRAESETEIRSRILEIKASWPRGCAHEDWLTAEKLIRNLVIDGEPWDVIIAGIERYAKHCKATGRLVQNPSRWFADISRPWLSPWNIPPKRGEQPAPDHTAEWAEAKCAAKAIHFRDPFPEESAKVYATEVKMAMDVKPMVPLAERRGLAGVKRVAK